MLRVLADFIYPRLCLHCDERLATPGALCEVCGELLELLDPAGRCPKCFRPKPGPICDPCHRSPLPWYGYAAALACWGPANKIRRCRPPMIKGMASFMVAQFLQQDWPPPELVMALPTPWWRRLRGPLSEVVLAKTIAAMIGSKYAPFRTPAAGRRILLVHDHFAEDPLRHWGGELIKQRPKTVHALTFC